MQRLILFVLLIGLATLTLATGPACPKVVGKTTLKAPKCNSNNKCIIDCGKYSNNNCQGQAQILVTDTKLFQSVCPFEGARLVRATSFVKASLVNKNKDSVSKEIVKQASFWATIQEYVATFSKASSVQDRLAAQKSLLSEVQSRYNAYEKQRGSSKKGSILKQVLLHRTDSAAYKKKISKLIASIVAVALARKCKCTSLLRSQYKASAPQSEKDRQWEQGTALLDSWVGACKALPSSTQLCKAYKIKSKDVSCAALPDEKGCLPVFSKLYEEAIGPLKTKLASGKHNGPQERHQVQKVPEWLQTAQKQNPPKQQQQTQPVQPIVEEPTEKKSEPKQTAPAKPAQPVEQKPAQPATPTQPVVQAPPTKQGFVPVEKPKLNPLVLPKVPKKPKVAPAPTIKSSQPAEQTGNVSKQQTGTPVVSKPVQTPKVENKPRQPTGPSTYVGQKKKINIANQK